LTGFFLSQWFAEALKFLNSLIGNYAVSIILLTLLVKLLILPLDIKQKKQTLKTTELQVKIADIKKRYPAKEKQNEKIQELYRAENVKPMGGCLTSLISLPILIALIGAVAIIANEELIKFVVIDKANPDAIQPFLWVRNMWQPDSGMATVMPTAERWAQIIKDTNLEKLAFLNTPELVETAKTINYEAAIQPALAAHKGFANGWFVLPVLCGGVQLLQAKIMPAMPSADGSQKGGGKSMFYIMAAFGVIITNGQSALFALYWIVSSLFAIATQLILNKAIKKKDDDENGKTKRLTEAT
jgi:YidC/Oxa1 family membrane protein insertase